MYAIYVIYIYIYHDSLSTSGPQKMYCKCLLAPHLHFRTTQELSYIYIHKYIYITILYIFIYTLYIPAKHSNRPQVVGVSIIVADTAKSAPSGAVEIPSARAPAFPVEAWLWMVWKLSSIMWICIKNMKRIQQNQHETERHSIFRVCPTLCFGDLTWNLRDHESFTSSDPATSLLAAGRIPQQWNGSITTAQDPQPCSMTILDGSTVSCADTNFGRSRVRAYSFSMGLWPTSIS